MLLQGRYKLLSTPLSTGSFGSVFMADDDRMPRRVAVKILHPQHAENPTVRARFRRELEAACRVSHENVVSVFDIGEDPKLGLFYVMELVKGTPLKDYLNGEPLPWLFVHRVATQIARALHAIHSSDIVHRDLKPQNIMLVERSSLEELVKVLDFGIASLKSPEEDKRDVELTGARMVLGTPPYMSPEQTYMKSDRERLGLDVDARSDIYSFGVILYEMAAGRRPFSGDAHDIVVAHRLTRPMPLDRMVGVSVPREFADLVMRCLAKDPKERPQSARELLQAMRDCELKPVRRWSEVMGGGGNDPHDLPTQAEHVALPADASPVDTRPRLELPSRSRTRALWGPLAALGVGAVAAIVAFAMTRSSETTTAGPSSELAQIPVAVVATPGPEPSPPGPGPGERLSAERPAAGAGLGDPPRNHAPPAADDARPAVGIANTAPVVTASAPQPVGAAIPGLATSAPEPGAPLDGTGSEHPTPSAGGSNAASPASQATERRVGVMLTTQPPGATVLIGGEERGVTPVTLSFALESARELDIVLRKDRFEDRPILLPVGPELDGQTLVIHQALDRKRAVRGVKGYDPFQDL